MVSRHVGGRLNHRNERYVVNDDLTPVSRPLRYTRP